MLEKYEHYISKNITSYYKRRLFSPIVYLMILFILWQAFSLSDILFPEILPSDVSIESAYRNNQEHIRTTLTDLRFTGYTRTVFGRTTGYYYYTMRNDSCVIVLLRPTHCEQGLPTIEQTTVTAKIMKSSKSFDTLLENLSKDLNWTKSGIKGQISNYYISEPDYNIAANIFLFAVILISGLYALISLILCIVFMKFPVLAPCCQDLARFGNPKELLELAEDELATLPQLATEDMFITEHFFIETSVYGNAIVPIDEIVWIYKYSTLHKFFWYHFSISYTLHISANKHVYIQCPKNMKSDIDGIIDYLAEANHNILVGFNEKNRLKVQETQGTPMHFDELLSFLKKRI